MKKIILFTSLLMTMLGIVSHAATIVEIDSDDGKSMLYSDGKTAKITMEGEASYMILDSEAGTYRVVMDQQKMVMDMTETWTSTATPHQDSRIKINSVGAGPELVGYSTKQYDLLLDGVYCGSVFSSTQALTDTRLARIFVMFQKMAAKTQSLIPAGSTQEDRCDSDAEELLIVRINEIGMPLKVLNKKRKVDYQIAKITLDTQLAPNVFDIPKHYKVQNIKQMQQTANEQMQKHMPQIEQMMQQMQQSGQALPPAAAENMQKLQQIMEQMQKN